MSATSDGTAGGEFTPESDMAFGVMDWTELPGPERHCLRWMLRLGEVGAAEAAIELEMSEDDAYAVLEALVGHHLAVRVEDRVIYVGNIGHKTARFKPGGIWDTLSQKLIDE
jgi:hypothetical protein